MRRKEFFYEIHIYLKNKRGRFCTAFLEDPDQLLYFNKMLENKDNKFARVGNYIINKDEIKYVEIEEKE